MRLDINQPVGDDLKSLLEENLKYAKAIYASTEKTRRYILWGQIAGFLKILLIIVPLVLGYIYLQPYLKQMTDMYQQVLGTDGVAAPGNSTAPGGVNVLDLIKKLQNSGYKIPTTTK